MRILIGWLPASEGAHWLKGRELQAAPDPELVARCERARASVAARPLGIDQAGLFASFPAELQESVAALRKDPLTAPMFAAGAEPRLVDLAKVCAVQPHVQTQAAKERARAIAPGDLRAIAALTLAPPAMTPVPATFEPTRNAWVISSPNPNLRVVGNFNQPVGPGFAGFGFAAAIGGSCLEVGGVGGRYFLRDGYHRAFGLLSAGIRQAPALVREFGSWAEVGLPAAATLPPTVVFGDRPPRLTDYLDDAVAAETTMARTRKIIVVQALELNALE